MKVLITGVTGFAGSHLADYYNQVGGIELWGTRRPRSPTANIKSPVRFVDCDITDAASVRHAVLLVKPDVIHHLAAQSYVPLSWTAPHQVFDANLIGTLNVLEAVRQLDVPPTVHVAGSSEEYGLVHPHECPITEGRPLRPMSPYGVSKVACDLLAQQYVHSYKMHIVITRAFNHTGPRRGEHFATSSFARQIAMIEAGRAPDTIYVGDLSTKRDFTDVRDMVRAYALAVEHCAYGAPYNIASGVACSIGDVLDILCSLATVKPKVEVSKDRLRPSDVPLLLGDSTRFRKRTGWTPAIPFTRTLQDLLDYWRAYFN